MCLFYLFSEKHILPIKVSNGSGKDYISILSPYIRHNLMIIFSLRSFITLQTKTIEPYPKPNRNFDLIVIVLFFYEDYNGMW